VHRTAGLEGQLNIFSRTPPTWSHSGYQCFNETIFRVIYSSYWGI
jgi:hypothetical protein